MQPEASLILGKRFCCSQLYYQYSIERVSFSRHFEYLRTMPVAAPVAVVKDPTFVSKVTKVVRLCERWFSLWHDTSATDHLASRSRKSIFNKHSVVSRPCVCRNSRLKP